VPIRAEVRTLKDAAPSNFSSTPLPERNRGNSYRESGLFCQQFNFFNFFDSFFSLRQPSNPHLLAHGASYVPTLCEIKRQTESNRGNQVDYDCPTNKLDLYGRFLKRVRRNLPRSRLPIDCGSTRKAIRSRRGSFMARAAAMNLLSRFTRSTPRPVGGGVRWYEFRIGKSRSITLYQQGPIPPSRAASAGG